MQAGNSNSTTAASASLLSVPGETVWPLNPEGDAVRQFGIGDLDVFQVYDGANARDIPPSMGLNVSNEELKAALREGGLSDAQYPNTFTVTVVRTGGKLVMFDSGNGENGPPGIGHARRNMRAAGLDPDAVSAIVMTHFHPDHIGGLLNKEDGQVYPDIPIYAPSLEYAFWTDPAVVDRLPAPRAAHARRLQAILPGWRNIVLYEDDTDVIPGIRAVPSRGHSPGHTSLLMGSGANALMVMGDVTHLPPVTMRHPGWHLPLDHDPVVAEATRRRLLDQLATDKIVAAGYHWGMPGLGRVPREGDGYRLVALA